MHLIEKYFPDLSKTQREQFGMLGELYRYWNEKINVISRKDIDHLYERHILHSLSIAKFIRFREGTVLLDVGTGGGFPGIPLAIMFSDARFVLVDSIGKKIKVVREISKALALNNTQAEHTRAEQINGRFDFVLSRAVADFPRFIPWVENKVKKKSFHEVANGIIALKGGDIENEIKLPFKVKVRNISDYFDEEFFSTKKIVHIAIHP
jgi:16S rRNA (guanine527-N7)-methyltransferase